MRLCLLAVSLLLAATASAPSASAANGSVRSSVSKKGVAAGTRVPRKPKKWALAVGAASMKGLYRLRPRAKVRSRPRAKVRREVQDLYDQVGTLTSSQGSRWRARELLRSQEGNFEIRLGRNKYNRHERKLLRRAYETAWGEKYPTRAKVAAWVGGIAAAAAGSTVGIGAVVGSIVGGAALTVVGTGVVGLLGAVVYFIRDGT
jgi:hypothetical protein